MLTEILLRKFWLAVPCWVACEHEITFSRHSLGTWPSEEHKEEMEPNSLLKGSSSLKLINIISVNVVLAVELQIQCWYSLM